MFHNRIRLSQFIIIKYISPVVENVQFTKYILVTHISPAVAKCLNCIYILVHILNRYMNYITQISNDEMSYFLHRACPQYMYYVTYICPVVVKRPKLHVTIYKVCIS